MMSENETQTIDRIMELIVALGMTHRQFAEEVSLPNSTLAGAGRNQRGLPESIITAIKKKYPAINLNWLIAGEGDMWNDSTISEVSKAGVQIAAANREIDILKAELAAAETANKLQQQQIDLLRNSMEDKTLIIQLLQKTREK